MVVSVGNIQSTTTVNCKLEKLYGNGQYKRWVPYYPAGYVNSSGRKGCTFRYTLTNQRERVRLRAQAVTDNAGAIKKSGWAQSIAHDVQHGLY